MLSSPSSAICSVSLSSNFMSLNHEGSEWPSTELTESLSGEGVSENSVLYNITCERERGEKNTISFIIPADMDLKLVGHVPAVKERFVSDILRSRTIGNDIFLGS